MPAPAQSLFDSKPVSLALQGGGGHGAFTWGVLDRLLEAKTLNIRAVSGTSGGALNAVIMADALGRGDEDFAREQLAGLWRTICDKVVLSVSTDRFLRRLHRQWAQGGINPFGSGDQDEHDPSFHQSALLPLIEEMVDFDRMAKSGPVDVYVSATNVRTGEPRIFTGEELNATAVVAASCMPFIVHAVMIDGEGYWDGTYSGNPPLWPLTSRTDTQDIILVHLYPLMRPGTPKVAGRILERMLEITFNNSILQELRAIDYTNRLVEEGRLDRKSHREHFIHRIHPQPDALEHSPADRLEDMWGYFLRLHAAGREAAEGWLNRHSAGIGTHSTFDLRQEFSWPTRGA